MKNMPKNISLSVMVFTYLFAGIYHFTKFSYFLSLVPSFLPHPEGLVVSTGLIEIFLAFFLAMSFTRRWACYGILLFWSMALPVNIYILSIGGAGIPLPHWQLAAMVPFHLFLMLWPFGIAGRKRRN
jgi:uncharacterized membrane protein